MSRPARAAGGAGARAWLVPAGFAIAFLGSLCGIGGGLFAVPLLHYLRRIPLKEAVATGLVLVVATTAAATGAEALRRDPDLDWPAIAALVLGVLAGTRLGYRASERVNVRVLRVIFVVFLAAAGARLVAGGSGGTGVAEGEALVRASAYLLALLVGIGGGFVTPLLGVGGGLVMVPGLFLAIPSL
ncbi:MAG: sulfite exporter TauE/SafE family protein, partial [Planctomycetota bacterium]